jgi:thioredoxin domain-containing protein 10
MNFLIYFLFRCGHCRHFEPVYEQIAEEVHASSSPDDELQNIRVVRIDATVHSDVANYYDIRGFPTIKFIRGSQIFSYENERSKSAVINFLKRVNGPSIRWITSIDQFKELNHEHDVFFLLLTTTTTPNEDNPLIKEYEDVVTRYISQAYFYATNTSIIQETFFSEYESEIFAIKKDGFYLYKPDNSSLEEFILREKVATFPQVAAGNMYDLILTKKIIIIYGFDEQQKRLDITMIN